MPTDIWWNVFYDVWNDYQLLQPAFEPGGIKPANNECVDDCLHLAKIGFMLRLYGLWNTHQYNIWKYKYNQKLQYLSNKIKEKANKKGVWLYYLHRAFIYTQMHQYDKAKTDIYDGCIQCGSTNDTVYALYSILLCVDGINQHTAIKVLQQGAGKCPGSNIINQLLDKLETEQTLTISDIQYLQLIENTDDNEEKIEFYSQNNLYENDSDNIESLMINVGSMIKNRDGIPIIYFVLRVLYNIIQFPNNNKVRQLDINQIRMRTNPYGQVTINILLDCGFELLTHNNKDFLLLRPDNVSDIKRISCYGDKINDELLTIPLLELIEGLKDFAIEELMNNYHHIILNHCNSVIQKLETFNYFAVQNGICNAQNCCILKRFYRNISKNDSSDYMRKFNFFGENQSSHIVFMQLMDEMHIYLYHSVAITRYENIILKQLSKTMNKLSKICFKRINDDDEKCENENNISDDDEEEDESKISEYKLYKDTNNIQIECNNYSKLYLKIIPKNHQILTHSKFIHYININQTEKKSNNNNNNHTIDGIDLSDKKNKKYPIIESFQYGMELNFWEWHNRSNLEPIKANYNGLKEEILQNIFFNISIKEWIDINIRCKYLYKSNYSHTLIANTKKTPLTVVAGIKNGQQISKNHLIVLYLWSNYRKLQIIFKKCCCKSNIMDSTQSIINKTKYITNCLKLLYGKEITI